MSSKTCSGALSAREIQELGEDIDLRMYTCAICGKRNLYAVKDRSGEWRPEPHTVPPERKRA